MKREEFLVRKEEVRQHTIEALIQIRAIDASISNDDLKEVLRFQKQAILRVKSLLTDFIKLDEIRTIDEIQEFNGIVKAIVFAEKEIARIESLLD